MSNIIEMLERVGGDARLRFATPEDLEIALAEGGDAPAARRLAGLADLLAYGEARGGKVYCAIQMPAEEEEQEDEGDADLPAPEDPLQMAELG